MTLVTSQQHSDQETSPLVSVIIPCYNSEVNIAQTIASVSAQTMSNLEIIVVDDCSTDGSARVVRSLCESEPRLRFFQQEINQGVARARNKALSEARGRYIAYLDSDDLWSPEKLEAKSPSCPRTLTGRVSRPTRPSKRTGRISTMFMYRAP